jgi:hypothetical protein
MPIDNQDIPWLTKVLYGVFTAIIGGAAGLFGMGMQLAKRDAASAERDRRIKALEEENAKHEAFCDKRKDEIIQQVSDKLCASFREMIRDERLAERNSRAGIETSLAVLVESNKSIKEDITEIFNRMNRRRGDEFQHHRGLDGP